MAKDNKEKQCVFCKKTLTRNKKLPICDSCKKQGRDWTFGGIGALLPLVVIGKRIDKDK